MLAIENEAAALFVIASLRGARARAICAMAGELYRMEPGSLPRPGRSAWTPRPPWRWRRFVR